jgi:hypothetical protein
MKIPGRKKPKRLPKRFAVVPIIVEIVRCLFKNQLPVTFAGALYMKGYPIPRSV